MASRAEIEARIVVRAGNDDAFRTRLLAEPEAAIGDELGSPLPEGLSVRVLEESADEVVLVLPPAPGVETAELSDDQLEVASGGTTIMSETASGGHWGG